MKLNNRQNYESRVVTVVEGESLTEQKHRDAVNINNIVARMMKSGQMPVMRRSTLAGDFTGFLSFHDAVNKVKAAEAEFMELPSAVRERFKNDPGELVEFFNDPENAEEAVNLGLVDRVPDEGVTIESLRDLMRVEPSPEETE